MNTISSLIRDTKCVQFHKFRKIFITTCLMSSNFELPFLHSCQEGNGESNLVTNVEKIMQETGIRGIIVNRQIINVFRKKSGLGMLSSREQRRKAEVSVLTGLQIIGLTRFTMLRNFIQPRYLRNWKGISRLKRGQRRGRWNSKRASNR